MKSLWRVPSQQAQPSSSLLWVSSQPPSGQRGGNTWYFKMCPFAVKSHKNSIHNEQNKNALKTKPACGYLLDEAVSFSLSLFFYKEGILFLKQAGHACWGGSLQGGSEQLCVLAASSPCPWPGTAQLLGSCSPATARHSAPHVTARSCFSLAGRLPAPLAGPSAVVPC